MKLKVKNQQGENLELDILPEDTFQDVQHRLFESGKIVLDMAKLASPNKPFSLSANVMEYLGFKNKQDLNQTNKNQRSPELERCEVSKQSQDVEGTQASSILHSQIDVKPCLEEENKWEDFPTIETNDTNFSSPKETNLRDNLPDADLTCSDQMNLEDIEFPADLLLSEPMPLCRLCAQEILDDTVVYIHEVTTEDETSLVDKINFCLPISVSLKDKLPKQICSDCLVNLESSYIFSCCVTSAEERLLSMQLSSKTEDLNCPLCCDGYMETIPPETEFENASDDSSLHSLDQNQETNSQNEGETQEIKPEETQEIKPELSDEDENHHSLSSFAPKVHQPRKRGRPRKFDNDIHIEEMDKDWSVEDEMEPPRKQSMTSRKGRPKGSKNRFTKNRDMSCFICRAEFKEFHDALVHTLNAHCDYESETFPCPLCQSTLTSEQELCDHIDTHNEIREIVIIHCSLCEMQFGHANEIHSHVIENHLGPVEVTYSCPVCECEFVEPDQSVTHVMKEHVDITSDTFQCPVCSLKFLSIKEVQDHFGECHIEKSEKSVVCSICKMKMETQTDHLHHIVDQHCTTTIYKVPSFYTCLLCKNKFKDQYCLVKHACHAFTPESLFCQECNKEFPLKARYVFHQQIHLQRASNFSGMRCDNCWADFSDEDKFYDHVRFQHEPNEQLRCEECNKFFKNVTSLNNHMKRHQPNRDHKCSDCGKKFQNAQTLREHQVSHMTVKPYQCHICGAYLSRLSRLRIHLRTHSAKLCKNSMKVYRCSECFQLFPNSKLAMKHVEGHEDVKNIKLEEEQVSMVFRCEFCDACFQKSKELNKHRGENHPDPHALDAYTCNVCGAQFSTFARVTTHKLAHGINTESLIVPDEVDKEEESFVVPQYLLCHECDKKLLNYTYMSLHRRFQHAAGKPVFTCSVCSEKFATTWSLQFHRKSQHNIDDKLVVGKEGGSAPVLYRCKECDKPYVTETNLENHMKRCHDPINQENRSSNFICETCGKTFQYKTALDAHSDAHRGMKRFECSVCYRRFTHRAGLIRHMKLHSEDDPFVCEFCGKKFRDKTERANHRRAHTGERPFMCEVCGRTFHTRSVWLDHSKIHEDIRPFECDLCSQTFRRSSALKSHYLIHTGERPFSCEFCGKTFRLKQTLYAHKKKEHPNDDSDNQNMIPHDVLLIEEDSQFSENFDQDDLASIDDSAPECEIVMEKTYIDSATAGVSGSAREVDIVTDSVIISSNMIKPSGSWKSDSKLLLNKMQNLASKAVMKERTGAGQTVTNAFSLLLKSDDVNFPEADSLT